jgi:GNAT superfamily N-acetyltransferase
MTIRKFDFTTADFERYVEIRNIAVPDLPSSVEFETRFLRDWPEDQFFARLLVEDKAGRTIATADYHHLPWSFGPQKFGLMIFVLPEMRRQGLGGRLFDFIMHELAPYDPTSLESQTREDWPDGVRFLEKRGFKLVNRQQQSKLDPARFEPERYKELLAKVEASGLVIKSLGQAMEADPEVLRKLHGLEMETMNDVPWYDEMTERPFEEWIKGYQDNPDLLLEGYIVAYDGDQVAGLSQLWGSQATDTLLYTGYTAVRRPYRQRGLATAMKVRAIQYAKRQVASDGKPPRIVTSNEETNPMLQINLRLGFEETPAWLIYVREV